MWLFRAIISLVGATLPLLFLSGSYSPIGSYLPNLLNLFGKESSLGNLLGIQAGPALPIGAAGLTGLSPVTFPTLDTGPPTAGRPGHEVSISIIIRDPEGATIRFWKVNVTTGFGSYDSSLGTPFTFTAGLTDYNIAINIPSGVSLGNYNLTISVLSWLYLDTQAQDWIILNSVELNETLVLTNNPPPSTNSGSSPPTSGQGPSTPTNKTTRSPISLLAVFRSFIIPVAAAYAALGLLATVLLAKQERKRSTNS